MTQKQQTLGISWAVPAALVGVVVGDTSLRLVGLDLAASTGLPWLFHVNAIPGVLGLIMTIYSGFRQRPMDPIGVAAIAMSVGAYNQRANQMLQQIVSQLVPSS